MQERPIAPNMTSANGIARNDEAFTFILPDQKPDVRLNVFGKEFHVHSTVLRLYSAFFRKFLDAPNPPVPGAGPYAYEYVTVVDEDGIWGLEKVNCVFGGR